MARRWSPVGHLALGLADAMLAGIAERRAVLERCAQALGAGPAWLPSLVRAALRRFADRWHPSLRDELSDFLRAHPALDVRPPSAPPRLRRWFLNAPSMKRAELGTQAVALPDLPAIGDLAAWLQLPPDRLLWLADRQLRNPRSRQPKLQHYAVRAVPKRHGGWRLIEAPKTQLRAVQRQVLDGLLAYVPPHEAAHGFRARHSPLTHARTHAGSAVVLRLDLQDFFLSIDRGRVRSLFYTLGYPPGVAGLLAGLCTTATARSAFGAAVPAPASADEAQQFWQLRQRYTAPHLPQGAPTSPALANLCAFRLDLRLSALAAEAGGRYTRYADDLAFSGDAAFSRATGRLLPLVAGIVADEGFRLNHRKTRVMRRSVRQRVVGLVINDRPNVARDDYDRLKAILHNCARHGASRQNRDGHADFRRHLAGRVSYVVSVNPRRGARLKRLFDAIDWTR